MIFPIVPVKLSFISIYSGFPISTFDCWRVTTMKWFFLSFVSCPSLLICLIFLCKGIAIWQRGRVWKWGNYTTKFAFVSRTWCFQLTRMERGSLWYPTVPDSQTGPDVPAPFIQVFHGTTDCSTLDLQKDIVLKRGYVTWSRWEALDSSSVFLGTKPAKPFKSGRKRDTAQALW